MHVLVLKTNIARQALIDMGTMRTLSFPLSILFYLQEGKAANANTFTEEAGEEVSLHCIALHCIALQQFKKVAIACLWTMVVGAL